MKKAARKRATAGCSRRMKSARKVETEIEKFFAEKIKLEPQLKHFNHLAFETGYDIVEKLKKDSKWRERILKK